MSSDLCEVKFFPLTLEKFLTFSASVKFDFILASHVFYHFSRWSKSINILRKLIKDNSHIFIILDSVKSSLYQLKPRLHLPSTKHIDEYGKPASLEPLVSYLKNNRIAFEFEELNSKLCFSSDVDKAIKEVLRIIAFFFRYNIEDVSSSKNRELVKNLLQGKLNKQKNIFEIDYVNGLVIL